MLKQEQIYNPIPAHGLRNVIGLPIVSLIALINPAHLLHHAIVYNDADIIARKHNVARSDWAKRTEAHITHPVRVQSTKITWL